MSETDGRAMAREFDEDERLDALDAEGEDLGDEVLDLDDELDFDDQVLVQQYVAEEPAAIDAGGLAYGIEDELVDDLSAGDAGGLAFGVEDEPADDDEPLDDEPYEEDDDVDEERLLTSAAFAGSGSTVLTMERLARLEEAAATLAENELQREQRKVRRKVKASTTGAGAIGLVPILLQLVGALDLDAVLAATSSTVAAIAGAFGLGWLTPERQLPVAESAPAKELVEQVAHDRPKRSHGKAAAKRRTRKTRSRRQSAGR